ncbi:MAG: hypothetical protein IPG24_25220 [Leptospiraceae bacterium]|nr:hypothetical protein [Leptospiraceae bacterium]
MNTNDSKIKIKNSKFLGLSIIFIIVLFTHCPVVKYNNPTDGAGGLAMQLLDSLKTTFSIDSPLKLVVSGNPSAISEGKNASVLLKMSKAVTASIKVTITSDNTAITIDGASTKELIFTPENGTTNQTITLAAVVDQNTVSETVNIKMTATGLEDQTLTITILDNTVNTPTITVKIGNVEYKNGDTIAFNVTKTNFDNLQTITILNNSSVNLSITGNITLGGTNSSNFTVIQPSLTTLFSGASTNFTLNFNTPNAIDKTATITIPNDDLANSSFTLTIAGKCNPAESFISTGNLITARHFHTATLLNSGKILIAGGSNGSALGSAELYDSSTGSFAMTTNSPGARYYHTASLLLSGNVWLTCGTNGSSALSSTDMYNPSTGLFTTGNMGPGVSRNLHTATVLMDGSVMIAAGTNGSAVGVERFSGGGGYVAALPALVTSRYAHTATRLTNGAVLIAGGSNGSILSSYEIRDGNGNPTGLNGSMLNARYLHTATSLSSANSVLIVGGTSNGTTALSSKEIYSLGIGFMATPVSMAQGRYHHTATLLNNGKVLIVGGTSNGTTALSSAELIDIGLGTVSPVGSLNAARFNHTATLLSNGQVLITGGKDSAGNSLSSAEIYYP